MPRAKRGFKARRRRNRILNHAEGFWGGRSRLFGVAIEVVHKAWQYAYIGRKRRKRDFRRLWVARINAAARANGTTYSRLIGHAKRRTSASTARSADSRHRDPCSSRPSLLAADSQARRREGQDWPERRQNRA
jgi:large subunit ribosomal protein L20